MIPRPPDQGHRADLAARWLRCLLALVLCLAIGQAQAHKASDSYLEIDATDPRAPAIRWDIALRDLDYALGLDRNQDGQISWGEVKARFSEIDAYTTARLALAIDGRPCPTMAWQHRLDRHSDGLYVVIDLSASCPGSGEALTVGYQLFFDLDASHRGLLNLRGPQGTVTAVLGPDDLARRFALSRPQLWSELAEYFRHGVAHIWSGIDHILFLLALLLPSVLERRGGHWEGRARLRATLLDIARVVTAFTLAHSITLTLATLGWVNLPSRLVESVIAASVVLAALNNLRPWVRDGRWLVAFAFGLIHGFGFAAVLTDLNLPRPELAGALLGFNLGVEAGQFAIVLAFVPLAWPLRATPAYRRGVLQGGSALVAVLAGLWLIERAFAIPILPFKV